MITYARRASEADSVLVIVNYALASFADYAPARANVPNQDIEWLE